MVKKSYSAVGKRFNNKWSAKSAVYGAQMHRYKKRARNVAKARAQRKWGR